MPIVPSRSKHIQALIAALAAPSAAERESAIARLGLVGLRAVLPLVAVLRGGSSLEARLGALQALAQIDDARARAAILGAADDPEPRLARAAALASGPPPPEAPTEPRALRPFERGLESLPAGAKALPALRDALRRLEGELGASEAWPLRLRIHRELVQRGSRIALYDLRDMLERRPPRDSAALLDLVAQVGDASVVPALARLAHDAPAASASCVETLAVLIHRERLRKTHRYVKAVRPEHRKLLDGLWAKATRRR